MSRWVFGMIIDQRPGGYPCDLVLAQGRPLVLVVEEEGETTKKALSSHAWSEWTDDPRQQAEMVMERRTRANSTLRRTRPVVVARFLCDCLQGRGRH